MAHSEHLGTTRAVVYGNSQAFLTPVSERGTPIPVFLSVHTKVKSKVEIFRFPWEGLEQRVKGYRKTIIVLAIDGFLLSTLLEMSVLQPPKQKQPEGVEQ